MILTFTDGARIDAATHSWLQELKYQLNFRNYINIALCLYKEADCVQPLLDKHEDEFRAPGLKWKLDEQHISAVAAVIPQWDGKREPQKLMAR